MSEHPDLQVREIGGTRIVLVRRRANTGISPLRFAPVEMTDVWWVWSCGGGWGRDINDVFHPRKRVEFHAEWLRDEPFDATTTGQILSTGVNSLLETGNMRFGWCHSCMLSLWSTILSTHPPDN